MAGSRSDAEGRCWASTAVGKALLAQLPPEQLDYYVRTKRRERLTRHTVTDRRALLTQLDEIRRAGVAANIDERVPGGSAIGAPIFALSGRPIAAISVAGPTNRIVARRAELARLVKDAAARITERLGTSHGLAAPRGPETPQPAARRRGRPMAARAGEAGIGRNAS